MKRAIVILTSTVAALLIAAGLLWLYVSAPYEGDDAWVYIPAGSDEPQVRASLTDALGPDMGARVYRLWAIQDGTPAGSHGAYRVASGTAAWRIARTVARGRQTPVRFTFPGVRTVDDMVAHIAPRVEASDQQLAAAIDSVLTREGYDDQQTYPALFVPNTHEVYWTASAEDIIMRLRGDYKRFWNDERQARARVLGLTPVEVSTLASIVEEETNKAQEQPAVARLYLNRLSRGMKLQADPTVKFALGDPALQRITDVSVDSPYNTYRYAGLPPGPIRIAEQATIDRVLTAPEQRYLYMCASVDRPGYHEFAADYATHQRNARRYRAWLDSRGIK